MIQHLKQQKVETLTLPSYAKLNLYLEVLKKRPDGYHALKTIFERISLSDTITFRVLPAITVKVSCDSPEVPPGERNLAFRACRLLQDELGIKQGVEIKIHKRIPVASGMGGGSSNAACVLLGLNKLWKLQLKQGKLLALAEKLGCDVPFFIYNTPFALGEARGDKIKPLSAFKRTCLWHLVAVPKIMVSTPRIYAAWDAEVSASQKCASSKASIRNRFVQEKRRLTPPLLRRKTGFLAARAGLTIARSNVKLLNLGLSEKDPAKIACGLFNSLQAVTFKLYPELMQLEVKLKDLGLKSILMSGSGPAIFGILSSRKEAELLGRQLENTTKSLAVFVARTC